MRFIVRVIEPYFGSNELSEQLGELPQLEQRRVWILREIAFREHSQPHELLVVRFEVSKVSAGGCQLSDPGSAAACRYTTLAVGLEA